eukprot:gene11125-7751_t
MMDSLEESSKCSITHRITPQTFQKIHMEHRDQDRLVLNTENSTTEIPDEIVSLARRSLASDEYFPGPMCCPFRKANIQHVKSQGYTIMEKSDGIRVLVVGYKAPQFPTWRSMESNSIVSYSFETVCALETAYDQLCLGEKYVVTSLGDEDWILSSPREGSFILSRGDTEISCCRTLEPWIMVYGLDRSMRGTYLFDSIFLCPDITYFVADAELVSTAESPSTHLLAFFDLYSVSKFSSSTPYEHDDHTIRRYTALTELMSKIKPKSSLFSTSRSVTFYAKEIFNLSTLKQLLENISYCDIQHKHFYNGGLGRTPNDGLIFTPEHFECAGGSRWNQLKWKWRECLTIDCQLYCAEEPGKYFVLLYLKKKCFPFKDDIKGHWRIWEPMKFENPHNFTIPSDKAEAVVVEARFDYLNGVWVMERLRHDKTDANFIGTAISVLESIAEDCSLCYLLEELCPDQSLRITDLEKKSTKKSDVLPFEKPKKFALFALRAKCDAGQHKLFLTWCTNKTNSSEKKIIHVPLCEAKDCSGCGIELPKDEGNSMLHNLLMIRVANYGGTYAWSDFLVEAYFDKKCGHWVITRLRPKSKNYMCTFDNVIHHLTYVLATENPEIPPCHDKLTAPAISQPQTILTNAHYGGKVELLGDKTEKRSSLREFNNLVKAFLIQWTCEVVCRTTGISDPRVIDMCCGRGGDLLKWSHTSLSFLLMTDASLNCVAEAAARYSTGKGMSLLCVDKKGFKARFMVHDAFNFEDQSLLHDLEQISSKDGKFHIASCQFSIHYGCCSAAHLNYFLQCISSSLASGGVFFGTTLSESALIELYIQYGKEYVSESLQISFPEESIERLDACTKGQSDIGFGVKYFTTVENCVSALPEYMLPWGSFCEMCRNHGLALINSFTFEEFQENYADELCALLQNGFSISGLKGRKRDAMGNLRLFQQQNTVASKLYITFAFKKEKVGMNERTSALLIPIYWALFGYNIYPLFYFHFIIYSGDGKVLTFYELDRKDAQERRLRFKGLNVGQSGNSGVVGSSNNDLLCYSEYLKGIIPMMWLYSGKALTNGSSHLQLLDMSNTGLTDGSMTELLSAPLVLPPCLPEFHSQCALTSLHINETEIPALQEVEVIIKNGLEEVLVEVEQKNIGNSKCQLNKEDRSQEVMRYKIYFEFQNITGLAYYPQSPTHTGMQEGHIVFCRYISEIVMNPLLLFLPPTLGSPGKWFTGDYGQSETTAQLIKSKC